MNTYVSGALVRVSAAFTDDTGAAADPTTVTVKYKAGTGSVQTPTATKDSVGNYHYDIDTTGWAGPGNQVTVYQFSGTGNVQAIDFGAFEVEPAAL